jgi:hypothetical protein
MPTDALSPPVLDELPEEFFLEGPVPDGGDLLLRTVARVHRHAARAARLRLALLVVAVVLAGAVVTGAGMVLGRSMYPSTPPVAERFVSATDPATHARLTAMLTSADGGTHIDISVTGLPAGTGCRLTVLGDGITLPDGSWMIGPDGGRKPVAESAWMPPTDITGLMVTTSNGLHLHARVG